MAKNPALYYEIQPLTLQQRQRNEQIMANAPGVDQASQLSGAYNPNTEAASRNYFAQNPLVRNTRQRVTHLAISPGLQEMRRLLRMGGRRDTVLASGQPRLNQTVLTAGMAKASGS